MVTDKNSRKWAHEEVLQRYIKENPHKWRINGKKSSRYRELIPILSNISQLMPGRQTQDSYHSSFHI